MHLLASLRWFLFGLLVVASGSAQIITNGSFESPALGSTQNYFGAFSFTGWSGASTGGAGNAGLVVGTDFGLAPYDGNQAFAFNGNNPAAGTYIEQTFNTVTGQSYSVTFSVGRNASEPSQALGVQSQVFNGGGSLLSATNATPPAGNSYSTYSFNFTADSLTSRLRFTDRSGSNPGADVFLDGVVVSAIPEPSTYAAMAGLAALAVTVYRRRKG